VIEALEIDPRPGARFTVSEEVRGFLGEADARAGAAAGPELGEEARLAVSVPVTILARTPAESVRGEPVEP